MIRRQVVIPAPPAEVWDLLTAPDAPDSWLGGHLEWSTEEGGELHFAGHDGGVRRGVVEAVRPPSYIRYRWWPEEDGSAGPASRVAYLLEPDEGDTRLTVSEQIVTEGRRGAGGPETVSPETVSPETVSPEIASPAIAYPEASGRVGGTASGRVGGPASGRVGGPASGRVGGPASGRVGGPASAAAGSAQVAVDPALAGSADPGLLAGSDGAELLVGSMRWSAGDDRRFRAWASTGGLVACG